MLERTRIRKEILVVALGFAWMLIGCNLTSVVVNSAGNPTATPLPSTIREWSVDDKGICYNLDNNLNIIEAKGDDRYKPGPADGCGCPEEAPDYITQVVGAGGVVICAYGPDGQLMPNGN